MRGRRSCEAASLYRHYENLTPAPEGGIFNFVGHEAIEQVSIGSPVAEFEYAPDGSNGPDCWPWDTSFRTETADNCAVFWIFSK